MANRKHVHKYYYGLKVGYTTVWACAFPGCTHYLPAHMEGAIVNRRSLCWNCSDEFTLDGNKHNSKPLCPDCMELETTPRGEVKLNEVKLNEVKIPSRTSSGDVAICTKCGLNPQRVTAANTGDGMCMMCWAKSLGISR